MLRISFAILAITSMAADVSAQCANGNCASATTSVFTRQGYLGFGLTNRSMTRTRTVTSGYTTPSVSTYTVGQVLTTTDGKQIVYTPTGFRFVTPSTPVAPVVPVIPKPMPAAKTSQANPHYHTHTCAHGHTWGHDGGPSSSHNCPVCGLYQNIVDQPTRVANVR